MKLVAKTLCAIGLSLALAVPALADLPRPPDETMPAPQAPTPPPPPPTTPLPPPSIPR